MGAYQAVHTPTDSFLADRRMPHSGIRVLVSAKSLASRRRLERLLRDNGGFEPISEEAGSQPDVALAEISTSADVDDLIERGVKRVIALANSVARAELLQRLGTGIVGILDQGAPAKQIYAALESATAGLITLPSEDWKLARRNLAYSGDEELAVETLTPREVEVLTLMARGLGNKIIAGRLRISEHTAKFHVSSILAKLQATSRTEAVAKGLRGGLVVV